MLSCPKVEGSMSSNIRNDRLGDDLIWGVKGKDGIAAFLGIPERKAYYLVSRGKIPVRKLGPKTILASRSELQAILTNQKEGGNG
jgi:hypothetical protein